MSLLNNRLSLSTISILLICSICYFLTLNFTWKKDKNINTINSDGLGYYMYLPNIFLSNTISNQEPDGRYIFKVENKTANKYFVGPAIAMAPFFAIGCISAKLTNQKIDGYSEPFQKAISIAAIIYLLLSLLLLKKLLELYYIKEYIISISLLLIVFATNLLVYVVDSPSMSHIYSFFFITSFLYFSKKLFLTQQTKFFYLMSFVLGMVALIRPIDGLIILCLPFLAGNYITLKTTILNLLKFKTVSISLITFFSILSLHLIASYIQTGSFLIWSYPDAGFNFLNPELFEVLFGFRKGLFIYTPIIFITFIGLLYLFTRNKFAYGWLLIFFIVLTYFISSWWMWYYGPSFSQRPFVEFYGLICIVLAILLNTISNKMVKSILIISLSLFTILNLVQSYQFQKSIISSWNMNYEKYKYTFLKTGDEYIKCLGGNNDIWPYKSNPELIFNKTLDFNHNKTDTFCDYSNQEFKATISIPASDNLMTTRGLFAKISLDRYELEYNSCKNALVIIQFSDSEKNKYHYYKIRINEVPDSATKSWENYTYNVELPKIQNLSDEIKIYIWNKEKKPFYIDNFSIKLYNIN
ncbi:MAG: hypothetical protein P1U41_03755 [Vicingaceae bacterium]|nr:hypothetical protein [Vicingaceae bacterium]